MSLRVCLRLSVSVSGVQSLASHLIEVTELDGAGQHCVHLQCAQISVKAELDVGHACAGAEGVRCASRCLRRCVEEAGKVDRRLLPRRLLEAELGRRDRCATSLHLDAGKDGGELVEVG